MARTKAAPSMFPRGGRACGIMRRPAPRWLMLGAMILVAVLALVLVGMFARHMWMNHEGFNDGKKKDRENLVSPPMDRAQLVFMYMNGCSWCEKFAPVWSEFETKHGTALSQAGVKLVKYERSEPGAESHLAHVKGFPTILLVKYNEDKEGGDRTVVFDGERTPAALLSFVETQLGVKLPALSSVSVKEGFYFSEQDDPTEFGAVAKGVSAAKKAADATTKDRQKDMADNSGGQIATSGGGGGQK